MLSVYIRVDAGFELGLGHVSRCRSIMSGLADRRECKFFLQTNDPDTVSNALGGMRAEYIKGIESFPKGYFDAALTDVQGLDQDQEAMIKSRSRILVCIDDEGPGLKGQDILIRPNLLGLPVPDSFDSRNYWTGRDYIILHPEFEKFSSLRSDRSGEVSCLFVCFGGSDPNNLTLRCLPELISLPGSLNVHILTGAAYPDFDRIGDLLKGDGRFVLSRNLPNAAGALARADMALISGGTLLYEACAMGVPSLVVCQNEAQYKEAELAGMAGAVVNMGLHTNVNGQSLKAELSKMTADGYLRCSLSTKGSGLVSAGGTGRIVSRILSRLEGRDEI